MKTLFVVRATLLATSLILGVVSPALAGSTHGSKAGLDRAYDPLALHSNVALVADADSHEVLYAKNPHAVLPIASITKLMTVMVNLEANLDLDEVIEITNDDIDTYKNTHSRLKPGSEFTRRELMHMALMASENRAASALGRSYPGGVAACVAQMNKRAKQLGMLSTSYEETTGLSVNNRSSASDLARLVMAARRFELIREFSTDPGAAVESVQGKRLNFHNTNRLVRKGDWDIVLQKTGFINEAGRCMVMQAKVGERNLVIVLLDAIGSAGRFADAERIRKFVTTRFN
ncbi:serine hydrolase [Limnobacter humi]|uniref:Serine hydrolase n=1 Tax=Limnobacter humi TaxID=1778671 RepID=A0ABT1WGC9_9BURK|nr:serine hydrolase [Limnobacter humi]MCQ8896091.1 serine hydrolase [Limnobacter humi]